MMGKALWLDGRRLFTENGITAFDVNGCLLPIGRYLGVTEGRNPAPIYDGFASFKAANLTEKVGDHSGLLQKLYERTNLQYQTETPESRISTEPAIGSWYNSSVLLNGVPSAPTHFINLQGTLYGLVPTSGLYYFDRPAKGWRLVQGNPAGSGPFTSMTRLGTGLVLLKTDGQVLSYTLSSGWGLLATPTIRDSVSLPLVTTVPSSASFYEAGQVDFSLQTQNYSLFTTVDGKSIRYYQDENYIDGIPRVFTEAAGARGLLSYHPKDTGFNVTLDPETLSMDGDNGGFLQRSGLPLSNFFQGEILVPPRTDRESVLRLDWSTMRVENFAFCQPNGAFITVAHDATKTTFYVLCGGPGTVRLAAVLTSTDFGTFTPHSWVLDPYRQAVYILGASSTQDFIAYHGSWTSSTDSGGWGAGTFSFTKRTVSPGGSCSGVIANLDLYNDTMGSRDVVALVSDVGRSNRPTWWRYSVMSDAWTKVTLTDQSPSAATDVQVTWANASSFQYNPASDAMAGHGAASPTGFQFLVRSNARSGRPTLFRWLRLTNTFESVALGSPDGLTLSGAEASGLTQSLGAVYHPTFKAVMWLATGATGQMKLYTLFEGASSSPTVWNLSVIGTGGTYLSTLAMGTPNVTSRSGSMLGRTFGDAYVGASTLVEDVFFWSPTQGLIQGVLSGSIGGFDTQTWSVFTKRIFTDQAVFSNTPTNCYSPQLGVDRGGELSLQMASYAEPELPPHGASSFGSCSDYEGVTWYDTGTVVKNLGLPYLWAGLSRGGYFWTANARYGTKQGRQTEYTFGTTVRGDVIISGFISASDFSWAITPDQKKVGIVYRTAGAPNRLIFVQYDVEADTLTIERAGTEFTGTYVVSLNAAVPQITYNSVVGSWDIVASEDSRDGGQLVFYRRMENIVDPNLAWSGERVGNNGDKPLASMVAQAGKAPATPLVLSDGSLLVLTECGANFDALLTLRDLAGNWSTVHQTSSGGFEAPKLERTTGSSPVFWVLGGSSAGQAGVLRSDSATSGWTFAVTPNPTQTSGFSNYCRVRYPVTQATVDGVRVACPLPAETGTSANRELGVFFLSNDGSIYGSAFAARGRLVSLSAQEESSYNFVSWTYKGDLLYRANRPSKPLAHWTIVRSKNGWKSLGESVVGSGRLLALQDRQYREEFVSVSQAETKIVTEFPSLVKKELLPLGTRKEGELFGLKWQTSAYTGSLFGVMNDSTTTLETSFSSGALAIINSRRWPRISGNTQGILSGGSVFGYGAGIRLGPPAGVTQSNYFGSATLPASGLFRLEALPAITFIGTHTFKNSDSNTSYTINGPVTFLLTTTGQHLVLEFCTQNSLVLDPNATGLSYWLNSEHPIDRYALVLGENRDRQFLLSRYFGGHLLTHGTYEPREVSAFDVRFENRRSYVSPTTYHFDQIPTGVSKRFKFKLEGTNHGIQSIDVSLTSLGQFVVKGPYALGFQFVDFATDRLRASATIIRPVLTAHSSGEVVVLGD